MEIATPRKPPNAGKGRKKGTPNKVTGALKDMILEALDRAGGAEYLLEQSATSPTAFMALVGKVLPLQVANADDKPFKTENTVNLRPQLTKEEWIALHGMGSAAR